MHQGCFIQQVFGWHASKQCPSKCQYFIFSTFRPQRRRQKAREKERTYRSRCGYLIWPPEDRDSECKQCKTITSDQDVICFSEWVVFTSGLNFYDSDGWVCIWLKQATFATPISTATTGSPQGVQSNPYKDLFLPTPLGTNF